MALNLTESEAVEAANARIQAEFYDTTQEQVGDPELTQTVNTAATLVDPLAGETYIVWSERGEHFREYDGSLVYNKGEVRKVRVDLTMWTDNMAEDIRNLRQPMTRQLRGQDARQMAFDLVEHQRKHVWRMLRKGDTADYGMAYDGQFFFDTDHPGKTADGADTTFANLFAATPFSTANLKSTIQSMIRMRTQVGRPSGNRWVAGQQNPTIALYYAKSIAGTVAETLQQNTDSPTVFAGTVVPHEIDMLDGNYDGYWFLRFFHPDNRKPALLKVDGGAQLILVNGYDSEPGRIHHRAEWNGKAEWGMSYGHYDSMCMCKPS